MFCRCLKTHLFSEWLHHLSFYFNSWDFLTIRPPPPPTTTPLSVHWALNEIMHYQSEHHHHLQAFQLTCGKLPLFEVIHEMTSSFRATITRRRLQNTTFNEREELKWNQTQVLPLTSLMPNRLPKPAHVKKGYHGSTHVLSFTPCGLWVVYW